MHKKGITEEVAKKRSRRTVKHERAVVGASWEAIRAKRSQKPEVRAAARLTAIRESKEKKKEEAAKKKAEKAKVRGCWDWSREVRDRLPGKDLFFGRTGEI